MAAKWNRTVFALLCFAFLLFALPKLTAYAQSPVLIYGSDTQPPMVSIQWDEPFCFDFERQWNPNTHSYDIVQEPWKSEAQTFTLTCSGDIVNPVLVTLDFADMDGSGFSAEVSLITSGDDIAYTTDENRVELTLTQEVTLQVEVRLVGESNAHLQTEQLNIGSLRVTAQEETPAPNFYSRSMTAPEMLLAEASDIMAPDPEPGEAAAGTGPEVQEDEPETAAATENEISEETAPPPISGAP